jgi:type IV pilus assembly protein PilO
MEELIQKVMKAPLPAKIGGVAGVVVVITVLNFLLLIRPLMDQSEQQDAQKSQLEAQRLEKEEIAQNLSERRKELEILQQKLNEALTELPETADMDELLAQFNDVGKKTGLEIQKVQPGKEEPAGFYARIPVKMEATGNYHELATFFQEVGNLRRIVNVSNIDLKTDTKPNQTAVGLVAQFTATTFRFLDPNAVQGEKKVK